MRVEIFVHLRKLAFKFTPTCSHDTVQTSVHLQNNSVTEDDSGRRMRRVRSTALSKAVSSIPTCGYVDRRDKIDHHVRGVNKI